MEKILLNAEQAREVTKTNGYKWFKNIVFKNIKEAAECGRTHFEWDFTRDYTQEAFEKELTDKNDLETYNILRLMKELTTDYHYKVDFVSVQTTANAKVIIGFKISW